jgi:hypothetical protein
MAPVEVFGRGHYYFGEGDKIWLSDRNINLWNDIKRISNYAHGEER